MGALLGNMGVGTFTGDFGTWLEGALGVECLALWKLREGNLEWRLPCSLWRRESHLIGPRFGEPR
jgi:hypothetical protein